MKETDITWLHELSIIVCLCVCVFQSWHNEAGAVQGQFSFTLEYNRTNDVKPSLWGEKNSSETQEKKESGITKTSA